MEYSLANRKFEMGASVWWFDSGNLKQFQVVDLPVKLATASEDIKALQYVGIMEVPDIVLRRAKGSVRDIHMNQKDLDWLSGATKFQVSVMKFRCSSPWFLTLDDITHLKENPDERSKWHFYVNDRLDDHMRQKDAWFNFWDKFDVNTIS